MKYVRHYPECHICGAPGHTAGQCALKRLNEQQTALGPRPSLGDVQRSLDGVVKATRDSDKLAAELRHVWKMR